MDKLYQEKYKVLRHNSKKLKQYIFLPVNNIDLIHGAVIVRVTRFRDVFCLENTTEKKRNQIFQKIVQRLLAFT